MINDSMSQRSRKKICVLLILLLVFVPLISTCSAYANVSMNGAENTIGTETITANSKKGGVTKIIPMGFAYKVYLSDKVCSHLNDATDVAAILSGYVKSPVAIYVAAVLVLYSRHIVNVNKKKHRGVVCYVTYLGSVLYSVKSQ
ncbi:MAG: hypothetical protein LKJ83_08595 [Eubacteriaceae bacterium]|jgi:hypothetical protein|nr:hypothetical protein [Eubacteriaceae bacterium]